MSMDPRAIPIPGFSGKLVDVDVDFENSWVASYRQAQRVVIMTSRDTFYAPDARFGSFVRWVGTERVLLVDGRTDSSRENAFLFDRTGNELRRFSVGGAVSDVVVTVAGKLILSYMDDRIFGSIHPAQEGLCVFSLEGCLEFGYRSTVEGPVNIDDCHAMCPSGAEGIYFSVLPGFELVLLDVATKQQVVHEVPGSLRGSQALVHAPPWIFFHSPHGASNELYRWRPGAISVEHVGHQPGRLRGLRSGLFLVVEESGSHLFTPDAT